jgi:hypothetical protein
MPNFTLPSGTTIDIDRPDFALCKGVDDLMELKYALSEKIIDIELQIDLHEAVAYPTENAAKPLDWLPRAKAALKWSKLYRDECQNRQGRLAGIEKQRAHATKDRAVIDMIRAALPSDKFHALLEAAEILTDGHTRPIDQLKAEAA